MPKLTGIFDNFFDIEQIPIEDINTWLKSKVEAHYLLNYIGNLVLYPQNVPTTKEDLEIEFAILREAARRVPQVFFDSKKQILVIPQRFILRFPTEQVLIRALVESLNLAEVTPVYLNPSPIPLLKNFKKFRLLSTVISPISSKNQDPLDVTINSQAYKFALGTITFIPIQGSDIKVNLGSSREITVNSGSLGLFLDLRKITENE